MNLTQRIVAGVAVLAVVAAVAYLAFFRNGTSHETARYTNDTYGYTFEHPVEDEVRAESPEHLIVSEPGDGSETYVHVAEGSDSDFESFAGQAARGTCGECGEVAALQPFTSTRGLGGVIFYLLITGSDGEYRGPFFAYDISSPGTTRALLVYGTSGSEEDPLSVGLIADSIEIQEAEG
ncbi:MAG: hypothetical protein HYS26_02045 [Candidatus Kaiserbacteria bacterium]|nr:MAG: hypothetical protein HYS26_02045 [Candidatus Kaiserbacteria bacterium]